MAFALKPRKHLEAQLIQIVRRQLRGPVRGLARVDAGWAEPVHGARRSLKKVRAVVTLLKQAWAPPRRRDRKRLQRAARELSRLRDSAAIIETLDAVRRHFPRSLPEHTYGVIHRALTGARLIQEKDARREALAEQVVARLKKVRKSVKRWRVPTLGRSELLAVVAESYRRSRSAMEHARVTEQSATVHEWRKAVKTLWYQARLASPLVSGLGPLVAKLERLETDLGDDHNLVVLVATLRRCRDLKGLRGEVRAIERAARAMRQQLRQRAFALGTELHARRPSTFADWLGVAATARDLRQTAG